MADTQLVSLAQVLGTRLLAHGWTLALAESCTGGWVAQVATSIPGSSRWFERGFITYSNAAKTDMLGVPPDTLQRFGAVSEETATAMARGALRHSQAQISAAITGVAGPDGGTGDKPVGTVWFSWALSAGQTHSAIHHFHGDREAVRRQSVETALQGLIELTLSTDL